MNATPTAPPARPTRPGRNRRPAARAGAALAVALVLLVAGCSSSSEGSDPTTTAAPSGTGSPSGTGGASGSTPSTASADGDDAPTTSEVGPLTTIELEASETGYVDALVAQGSAGMTEAQTTCLAGYTVRAIGVDALQAAGITPEALASNEKSFNDLTIDEATATEMIDAFEPCGLDIVDYFLQGISGSVNDQAVMSCIEGKLTPEAARSLYISSITSAGTGTALDDFLSSCVQK